MAPLRFEAGFSESRYMANMQIVPAGKTVEPQHVEMKVPLYSFGCEKKVKKALSNVRGIHSVDVDCELQKVTVWGICNRDDVLATIRKKRREARFWNKTEPNTTECKVEEQIEMEGDDEDDDDKPSQTSATPPPRSYKFGKSWRKLLPLVYFYSIAFKYRK